MFTQTLSLMAPPKTQIVVKSTTLSGSFPLCARQVRRSEEQNMYNLFR